MEEFARQLATHDFQSLFIEALGWDRASRWLSVETDDRSFVLRVLAEKRGVQVATCFVDRYSLFNRGRLRRIQKEFARSAHEHILVSYSDDPKKQVWQWAVRLPDGRRLRHREHPFFSATPPEPLLARLEQLAFSLDEEESTTLIDVLGRVRAALDTRSELNLFVRKPVYAEQSDQLALAMRDGGLSEFHEFVLFHRALAKWATKRLSRWPGLDEEDAEQIGLLGIINAARKFKPELGYQFSTYATTAIKRRCHRHGPDEGLLIRVPAPVYWPHWHTQRAAERLETRHGFGRGRAFIDWLQARDSKFSAGWTRFRAATRIQSIDDRMTNAKEAVRRLPDPAMDPCGQLLRAEEPDVVGWALDALSDEDAWIIRLRYGLGERARTLNEVGIMLGLTRERIRQRQLKAEKQLAKSIREFFGEPEPRDNLEPDQEAAPVTEIGDDGTEPPAVNCGAQPRPEDHAKLNGASQPRYCEPKPRASQCRSDLVHAS